jgi:hypothetical protein
MQGGQTTKPCRVDGLAEQVSIGSLPTAGVSTLPDYPIEDEVRVRHQSQGPRPSSEPPSPRHVYRVPASSEQSHCIWWWRAMVYARRSVGARLLEWGRACTVAVAGIFTAIGGMERSPDASAAEGKLRINIATAILTRSASEVAMPIRIEVSERLPPNSFVRVRGLPPSVSLTDGFAIGPGMWAVPLSGLASLKVNVPVGVSGQSDFLITLVDVEGTILAEATSTLVVGPGSGYRPAGIHLPKPWLAEPSGEERASVEKRLARGVSHLLQGNIASAREFFRHAAEAGLAAGATLLAATFDPVELQRMRVVGVVADHGEAQKWYQRARELGAVDEKSRLDGCKC